MSHELHKLQVILLALMFFILLLENRNDIKEYIRPLLQQYNKTMGTTLKKVDPKMEARLNRKQNSISCYSFCALRNVYLGLLFHLIFLVFFSFLISTFFFILLKVEEEMLMHKFHEVTYGHGLNEKVYY